MSATLARLRKRAAELEQKKQFDRALEVYVQILDEGGKDLGDEDVPLFNRVGDMLMRKGSVTEALGYYERAVDMYAERGYLNNAIALCSKILRQSPGRAAVYYKLARISAKKGFKSDARKNFLEYADRMQKLGMADEAFRALKEFASLYPDQDDVRLVLAELLSKENRKGEALEQLQSLYQKLQSEGRAAEARATIDRMRSIDPSATPREGAESQTAAGDLVFLDLSDAESGANGAPQHASARAPMPTPVPALTGLSITFFPGEAEASRPEGFESTAVEAERVETAPIARSLTPAGSELVVEPETHTGHTLSDIERIVPLDMMGSEPATIAEPVERAMDALREEAARLAGDEDTRARNQTPMSGIEFADLELDESRQRQALREHDLTLPGELPATPEALTVVAGPSPASAAAAEDARAAAEEAADLAADIAAREAEQRPPTPSRSVPPPAEVPNDIPDIVDDPEPLMVIPTAAVESPVEERIDVVPDDFLSMPPSFGASSSDGEDEHAFPPIFGLVESAATPEEPAPEPEPTATPEAVVPTPRGTISIGSAEGHLRRRIELEPENWELRRQLGEALLDTGDRDGGLYELELAMTGFELQGDMDRSQEVVDEILRVFPSSVRHHQKRVEFAVRSRDRGRLTNSYLELADALFRTGAGDKAVAVYGRVLELDPQNERAEFALATLAPDELVRLRGVPARAERWTDELVAIEGGAVRPRDESAAEQLAPDESPRHDRRQATPRAADQDRYAAPPTTPVETLELPDPDWGEGVPPSAAAAESSPTESAEPSAAEAVEFSTPEAIEPSAPEAVESSAPEAVEVSAPEAVEVSAPEAVEPSDAEAVDVSAPEAVESSDPDAVDVSAPEAFESSTPEPVESSAPEPAEPSTAEEDWAAEPTTDDHLAAPIHAEIETIEESLATTADPASEDEDLAFDLAEAIQAEEAAEGLTLHAPTVLTPRNTPAFVAPSRREPAFHEAPHTSAESEFIDLGEWLRRTEPVRSTRMQVEDPKPTGDEQADFEEMLRRFKRGVAENVEAEDYEAHYDLGVAYKEMGLVDEAIAEFQKSLRGATHRVRSYEALGQCFVEKQQYPIAAALLRRATEVPGTDDQQLVGVLYLLGFATEHLGHPTEALPYYLRVFAVDIEFRDIAERVAALGNFTT